MKISKKREAGEILGRGGISERIIIIAKEIADGSYKEAIEKAGQISVLVDAASYDDYWKEKSLKGQYFELGVLGYLLENNSEREKLITKVNPYKVGS